MYGRVYDRIYEMHLSRDPEVLDFGPSATLMAMLAKLTEPGASVLEVGCGGGLLAIELARMNRRVIAIDASALSLDLARRRAAGVPSVTFEHVVGVELPYRSASFDFAYSVEVLEHLHEDDAHAHLREVRRVLRPGGRYWINTPNRLWSVGASDRFGLELDSDDPGGDIHLKEWTFQELSTALRHAGFSRLRGVLRHDRPAVPPLPVQVFAAEERLHRTVLADRRLAGRLGLQDCSVIARRPARASGTSAVCAP